MPDPNASTSIDRDQAIRIVSRLSAAYMLFWFLDDLTLLPRQLLSASHYLKESSVMEVSVAGAVGGSDLTRSYVLDILANTLRMAVLLRLAYPEILRSRNRITLSTHTWLPLPG